jgi:hypothetical protein
MCTSGTCLFTASTGQQLWKVIAVTLAVPQGERTGIRLYHTNGNSVVALEKGLSVPGLWLGSSAKRTYLKA